MTPSPRRVSSTGSTSLRALAARVVCAGFEGADPAGAPLKELRALGPGGIILFARNVTSRARTAELVAAVHGAVAEPPFVAIDQEGGRVARLRHAVELPPMMALGATADRELARRAGAQVGRDLRRIGVDVDFAPVVDLALEPRSTVIGARAFGADPALVAVLGVALAEGLASEGVTATAKHFPGHGATEVDSHVALPVLETDLATLRARELVPFAAAVRAGIGAVMVAHVVVRALDAERPASLSPAAIDGLLRGELGFRGAIFTDCLEMSAAQGFGGTPAAAVMALQAGADCVIVSHRLELARAVVDEIEQAVDDGRLTVARLEASAARLAALRNTRLWEEEADDAEIGLEIARRAVTVLRGRSALEAGVPVAVVSFEDESSDWVGEVDRASLNAALRRRGLRSEQMRVSRTPAPEDLELLHSVLDGLGKRELVIVSRRADLFPAQRAAIESLIARAPHAIVVSAREPYDAAVLDRARSLLCIYGDQQVCFDGLADVLTGRVRVGR